MRIALSHMTATALGAAALGLTTAAEASLFRSSEAPAPAHCMSLSEGGRATLREHLRARLQVRPDGSSHLTARAWAARAKVG
jgi:hypothetical protein